MTKATTKQITGTIGLRDDSVEAVVLEGDCVNVYLKSGSVIECKCIDEEHAVMRYKSLSDSLPNYSEKTLAKDEVDEYMKSQESSSEE